LYAGLEHVEIRPIGIHHGQIPDFVRTRSEQDFFPVSRPAWVIGIIARDIFENVNFSRGNVDDGDMTRVRRVARFLRCVKRDASPIGRDCRKDTLRDLFLTRAVEIGYPDRLIPFKRDLPIAAKN
jgi:hypothetical protein